MTDRMRLDMFLKLSRLAPRRTVAQQLCEAGAVRLNDAIAKSAREVHAGDKLSVRQRGKLTTVRILDVPVRPPSKSQAASLYEVLSIENVDEEPFHVSILLE